jgi:hypothetical protein
MDKFQEQSLSYAIGFSNSPPMGRGKFQLSIGNLIGWPPQTAAEQNISWKKKRFCCPEDPPHFLTAAIGAKDLVVVTGSDRNAVHDVN